MNPAKVCGMVIILGTNIFLFQNKSATKNYNRMSCLKTKFSNYSFECLKHCRTLATIFLTTRRQWRNQSCVVVILVIIQHLTTNGTWELSRAAASSQPCS